MNWDYAKVLSLLKEREFYGGHRWYEIHKIFDIFDDYCVRVTKDVIIFGYTDRLEICTPVKNSYRVESINVLYYEDLEDIRITHLPLEFNFKLKNMKSHVIISTPMKWHWGIDVVKLPVFCEKIYQSILRGKPTNE